ncbi:simple sugar transport system ATP-binding protein [Oscillibacter sp. PC13]|uniref:ABC transporter ATP-binding protein n=1 Tax=Oscillibacter sp. PC13 TaxID=1855299 RepID=UPI0008EA1A95|nr:ABC transporter ATP-binding protein [Oscillibacter sp. PC13]SFP99944.1 simple sugar transport system ATP-binding protein [Oscillibacter sp. PC13]
MPETMISMKDVTIRFGSLTANDKVSLEVKEGEIMSLLGENGAGKSTLMKILYGLYTRESGEIVIDGNVMPKRYAPADAIKLGVSMVPQHFMLIDSFTVAENIVLGEEQQISHLMMSKEKACAKVDSLCEQFGIPLSPKQIVGELPMGTKQKVEILKALYRGTKVLILDEPTTVLTPQEVDELFVLLRSLQRKGITIIIITHKLNEVLDISDRVTVMRLGKNMEVLETSHTNAQELSRIMVGKEVSNVYVEQGEDEAKQQNAVFRLVNLHTKREGERCNLQGINLDLFPGKVVGVAGIDGNGQTDLVEVLTGTKALSKGEIRTGDQCILANTVEEMRTLGIGIIPEDRTQQGLVLDLTVRDNILLGYKSDTRFEKHGIINLQSANKYIGDLIQKYDIRPARGNAVCRFISGGNQQKVVLARELERTGLKAVVASQPVRGLDVGAIQFTHSTLLKLRSEGMAILLISSDLDEIKTMSDYIAIIRNGRIVAFKKASDFSKDEIGLYMGGAKSEEVTA